MVTNGDTKVAEFLRCESCDYYTCRKSSFLKHLSTDKHSVSVAGDKKVAKVAKSCNLNCENCGKKYSSRNGLWKHKKICNIEINTAKVITEPSPELIQLITELVKGQHGLQESILEICKTGINYNSHNNTSFTNSNNKSFNLQVFLNETCKDAMNISEFVDSIQLQLSDLEKVGRLGFVDGISDIIVKNLKKLDVSKRPIHCTDKKREILYVKDDNKWKKEGEKNDKIRDAVKTFAFKNTKLLKVYRETYPEYNDSKSNKSDYYSKLVIEAMGGLGTAKDSEKEDKIIKIIANAVTIDKEA